MFLVHYNHKHDKLGRFASSSSAYKNGWKDINNEDDYTISKGTTINRVTTANKESDTGVTYGTHTEVDKNLYVSVAKDWLSANRQIEMTTTKDVKVAGVKTQAKAFVDLYKTTTIDELVEHSTPTVIGKNGKQTRDSRIRQKETRKIYKNATKNQKAFDTALWKFNQGLGNKEDSLSKRYMDDVKNRGYDAMTDINDLNFSQKPVIFIQRNKSLRTKKVKDLTDQDVDRANEYLKKRGLGY